MAIPYLCFFSFDVALYCTKRNKIRSHGLVGYDRECRQSAKDGSTATTMATRPLWAHTSLHTPARLYNRIQKDDCQIGQAVAISSKVYSFMNLVASGTPNSLRVVPRHTASMSRRSGSPCCLQDSLPSEKSHRKRPLDIKW